MDALVIMQMCQCFMSRSRSAPRNVYTNRPSINQETKHAEIPQIHYIDKVVVDMPVVMQRQVPQIQREGERRGGGERGRGRGREEERE